MINQGIFIVISVVSVLVLFVAGIGIWIQLGHSKEISGRLQSARDRLVRPATTEHCAPIKLRRDNWAAFERAVQNLKQVIVVADVVQKPDGSLRDAVIHNFSRGVRYTFIVSKNARQKQKDYVELFRDLASIAIHEHSLTLTIEQMIKVEILPDDWNGVPFVFYRIEDTNSPLTAKSRFSTLAFWGNTQNAGIAEEYEALPGPVADALATALVSGAPSQIKSEIKNLEDDNFASEKVVGFVSPVTTKSISNQ